jgi:enoyl-CoA hydratase/carnithine racemase
MSDQEILLRQDNTGVARLVLNRPAARNSLSMPLMAALQETLDTIKADATVRVVVIAANGPAFCAGHDLKEIRAEPRKAAYERLLATCSRLMTSIVRLPQPVIAEVQGVATAAGCQLVATADLAIAANTVRFATPGVNIGLFCSTPMVALSRNVARKHAMEMLLTGDMIDCETAIRFGLINRAVEAADLTDTVMALARQIATKSKVPLTIGKEAFYRQLEGGLDAAYAYASEAMTRNLMAGDAAEGIDAFIEKRDPVWQDG